ncbi:MAG: hypothetical protein KDK39_04175 [Leptospiraceae bacterium]|nr:hypothetical protein [Leptospiraceae bacterium]
MEADEKHDRILYLGHQLSELCSTVSTELSQRQRRRDQEQVNSQTDEDQAQHGMNGLRHMQPPIL